MQIQYFKKSQRLGYKISWLEANFYFSFGNQYDPNRTNFGALLVVNDDIILPKNGFGTHSHNDMEIITIPLAGVLTHKDSTGGSGEIAVGEVQTMTAGTGISHSEYNNGDEYVNSFQIWILPALKNLTPNYNQKKFPKLEDNIWQLIVSPDGRLNSLVINQDSFIWQIQIKSDHKVIYQLESNLKFNPKIKSGIFLTCLSGKVQIEGLVLESKDWLEITHIDSLDKLSIESMVDSKVLLIQVPIG